MDEQLDSFINNHTYLDSFGEAKIIVEVQAQSRLNYEDIVFCHTELYLNYCNSIFEYWYRKQDKFTIQSCARYTKISPDKVREIYDKYIK
jgi:hypothetical protein